HRRRRIAGWRDHLRRSAAAARVAGAQHRVALDDQGQALSERGAVEVSIEEHGGRDVVGGVAWGELVEKEQPLLLERQRRVLVAAAHGRRCGRRCGRGVERGGGPVGQRRGAGPVEDEGHRQLDAERLVDAARELDRLDRVEAIRGQRPLRIDGGGVDPEEVGDETAQQRDERGGARRRRERAPRVARPRGGLLLRRGRDDGGRGGEDALGEGGEAAGEELLARGAALYFTARRLGQAPRRQQHDGVRLDLVLLGDDAAD